MKDILHNKGIIQIIGISGSGKTTVAQRVANQLSIKFVDFADLLVECANSLGTKADSHDNIINFTPSFLAEAVSLARLTLLKMSGDELLILETHLAPRIKNLWYTFTSPDILKERNTLGIVVVADDLKDLNKKNMIVQLSGILSLNRMICYMRINK
ncbi:MAG: AAA family ATPase [Ignavibacteriaceae bacterium]